MMATGHTVTASPSWREGQMILRGGLLLLSILFLLLAVVFYTQSPLVRQIWPWTGYQTLARISYSFVAAAIASFAVPLLWVALSGDIGAAAGISLLLAVSFLGSGIYMLQEFLASGSSRLLVGALVCLAVFLGAAALFLFSRRIPFRDATPHPRSLRVAFWVFVFSLLGGGFWLVIKHPLSFPWTISTEAYVIYGWAFLGGTAYGAYALLKPVVSNARGQLIGFLAYDLLLLLPFFANLGTVRPDRHWNFVMFIATFLFSGAVAVYYLFLHPQTRFLHK
jgi:hypothetical protein